MEEIKKNSVLLDEACFGPLWKFIQDETITDIDYNGMDLWLTDIHKVKTKADSSVVTAKFLEVFINKVSMANSSLTRQIRF